MVEEILSTVPIEVLVDDLYICVRVGDEDRKWCILIGPVVRESNQSYGSILDPFFFKAWLCFFPRHYLFLFPILGF